MTFYWGVGFEEVAAATSAKEMLRQGWQHELQMTVDWLEARRWPIPDAQLERLYNTNLFFCLFYSAGLTLDTEELSWLPAAAALLRERGLLGCGQPAVELPQRSGL